ncbi:uncharacterized protein LOC108674072 [Hyalella azteca]|uniref:Uncharacterized protein LOC108674072 n=1 Tax=Hyalella azteca TaxID=294128 RepID=A0A8B7NUM7_HYAAZ|nr:uncharacterized protein LOC108674072 [Hyalella azteca]
MTQVTNTTGTKLGIPENALCNFRCQYVVENIGKNVMQLVIQWLGGIENMNIKERLERCPGFTDKKYRREFNEEQRSKIDKNADLSGYDITLCYKLAQRICGLSSISDRMWNSDSSSCPSLEFKLQSLKSIRNALAHGGKIFPEESRMTIESLSNTFTEILYDAGARASIDKAVIDEKIREVKTHIQVICGKIREPLNPNDREHFQRLQDEARLFQSQLKVEFLKQSYKEINDLFQKLYKIEPAPWALHQQYEASPTQVFVRVKVREDKVLSSKKGLHQTPEVPCDQILEIKNHASVLPDVIILSGEGGKGKTSLIKYFLEEYLKGPACAVQRLAETELVLYVEARNDQIKSFNDLLIRTIPSTYLNLTVACDHLTDILMGVNKLFLIDGFDEHNPISRNLVKELVNLPGKNRYIITTRPTSVEDVNMLLPDSKSKLNLLLQGIPEDQHENFVLKLFRSLIEDEDKIIESTKELMKCLRRLKQTLGEQLNTPLNLALIVLLYSVAPETVRNLSSSFDLYHELRSMMTDKLVFRLVTCTDLTESPVNKKCKRFLRFFDQTSFRAFCRKEYELRDNTKEKFECVCEELNLPDDLVLSSYLNTKRSLRGIGSQKVYTYQHLMMLEFAAGCHLAREVIQYVESLQLTIPENAIQSNTDRTHLTDDETDQDECIKSPPKEENKMSEFSGLSPEKATKTGDSVFKPRRRKLSVSNNIIWKVIQKEYPIISSWNENQREDFISRAQNVLMFMTGAIRATNKEHLVSIASDIVQLVDDEETTNGQPYTDILMKLVAESGNDEHIIKFVAVEVNQLTKKKFCIVKENSLGIFHQILRVTCPEMIAIDICTDPQLVFELNEVLQTISKQMVKKLSLVFRHMYHDGHPGDCAPFLVPLNGSTTCELAEFWGALSNEGLDILPECLGVMNLRLPPEQIGYLNQSLDRLQLWSLGTVVNLSHRPDPTTIEAVRFKGPRLVLLISAVLRDCADDIEWALDALENLCPEDRNKQVTIFGYWDTKLTYTGAVLLLEGLHRRGFVALDFVVMRSTELIQQAQQDELTNLAHSLGQKKFLIIKDP